jgi:serine protease Do
MTRKVLIIGLLVLSVAAGAALLAPAVMGQARERAREGRPFSFQLPFEGGSRIGASVRDVQDEDVSREKLESSSGAVVERLDTEGPAGRAGLRAGDVVVELDGERVRSALHLTRLVRETPEGRQVPMVVVRQGSRTTLNVTPVGPRAMGPDDRVWREPMRELEDLGRNLDLESLMGWGGSRGRLGIDVQPLTPQLAAYFGVTDGLLVANVVENSPAARAGFKAGDVILSVNGTTVATRGELVRALRGAGDATDTSIEYSRQGQRTTAKVTLERPEERPRVARPRGI